MESVVCYVVHNGSEGAQWLSCRVLDSRPRGHGSLTSVTALWSLSKTHPSLVLVQPRKTRPCLTERLLMGRKESNQANKQNNGSDLIDSLFSPVLPVKGMIYFYIFRTVAWRVLYVVHNGSDLVDSLFSPVLPVKDTQDVINTNTGSQYVVYGTAGFQGYRISSEMFSYSLLGQTPKSVTDKAAEVMKASWQKKLNSE